jgi:SAM-dependent methyltransferase
MSGFSPEWLALREGADSRSRWPDAVARLAQWPALAGSARIVDLGSGTGSNCRHLAPRLGRGHDWLLVDHDAALLARASTLCSGIPGVRSLDTMQLDLATRLDRLPLQGTVLLTASALLDLVSESWLTQLVERCTAAALPVLIALSYDGRMQMTPADPDDAWIRSAVNAHQMIDKGFGPALGPTAIARAQALFGSSGHQVFTARSDWLLDAGDANLQRELIHGWADAAAELHAAAQDRVRQWQQRRLACVDSGSSTLLVGHEDLLTFPGAARAS